MLVVNAVAKSWGPGFLMFALDGATDFAGGDQFTIGTRYLLTDAGPLGAEWATDVFLGTDTLVRTEWFQPLETERAMFVAPRIGYRRQPVRAPVSGQISELSVQEIGASIDIGTHAIDNFEFRFGVDRGIGEYEVDAGLAPSADDTFDDGGLHANVTVDTLDRSTFPSAGVRAVGEWRKRFESMGADADYEVATLTAAGVTQVAGQNVALLVSGQFDLEGTVSYVDAAQLGGLFRLSGLRTDELVGTEGGLVTLLTYRSIGPSISRLSFPVYVGASLEIGGVFDWGSLAEEDVIHAGSIWTGIDSVLGPVFLALGFAEGGQRALYFSVGSVRF
jgi:NTE family protein